MELSKEWYHTELANSEYDMLHRSPTVEYSFYNAVKTGDMDSVIRNCKEDAFIDLKVPVSFPVIRLQILNIILLSLPL